MFKSYYLVFLVLFFMGVVNAANADQGLEIEPNDTCKAAQNFSGKAYPFAVSGDLKLVKEDTDFFKFTSAPKSLVKINIKVAKPDEGFIYADVYDSSCDLVKPFLANPLVLPVPDDGVFIIWVNNVIKKNMPYVLSIASVNKIGSITGELFDSNTQQPLDTKETFANLYRCIKGECQFIRAETPDAKGLVTFAMEDWNTPLIEASYKIVAGSKQYEVSETPVFYVAKDQHKRVNVPIKSYPTRLSVNPCIDIPSKGGNCKFSVTVVNGQPSPIKATVWNIAQNFDIPLPTVFPIGSAPITLPKIGAETTLNFSFFIPASLPDYAFICAASYVGAGEDIGFNLLGTNDNLPYDPGFCFFKEPGKNTLTAVSGVRPELAKRRLNYLPRR